MGYNDMERNKAKGEKKTYLVYVLLDIGGSEVGGIYIR